MSVIIFIVAVKHLFLFFFNDTATTEIYTLSLHDALPISSRRRSSRLPPVGAVVLVSPVTLPPGWLKLAMRPASRGSPTDRKSTRLNSSHANISYAVFCLKKKKKNINTTQDLESLLLQF